MKPLCVLLAALLLPAAMPALADDGPILTVYTYDSFTSEWGPGPKIKSAFEAQNNCRLDLVGLADGAALLSRLRLEGPQSPADIVLGLDTNLMAAAKQTGLFARHGLDIQELDLALPWKDESFLPYDYGYFAVVYDTQALSKPPGSLRELVEGGSEPKLVIQDPRTSTPGLGLLLWVKALYGPRAEKAWEMLSRRILTVTKGWSEAYGIFLKGEAPMVLSYTTSPAYHMVVEKTERYQAASFEEGHYQQIEIAACLKSTKQPRLAQSFLKFMLSPAFQDVLPTTNWMFPAAKTSHPLPDAFSKLTRPARSILLSSQVVAAKRKAWIDEWLRAMSK